MLRAAAAGILPRRGRAAAADQHYHPVGAPRLDGQLHRCAAASRPSEPVLLLTQLRRCCPGCSPTAPCEPGNCPCGNCFPGVRPWYNEDEFHPLGPPPGCKPCSKCKVRTMFDFRQILFSTCLQGDVGDPLCTAEGTCDCSKAQPPEEGECAAPGPGIVSCQCWCSDEQKLRDWCGLDTTPTVFPGPCAYDKQVAESKGEAFTAECDEAGYYKPVRCGPKPPPALPPSPPSAFYTATSAAASSPAAVAHSQAGEYCWCVEPSYGIENGTTAVPKEDGAPQCLHTLQCPLLNAQGCKTIGAQFCNWTVIPFDNGTYCAPTAGGPTAHAALP